MEKVDSNVTPIARPEDLRGTKVSQRSVVIQTDVEQLQRTNDTSNVREKNLQSRVAGAQNLEMIRDRAKRRYQLPSIWIWRIQIKKSKVLCRSNYKSSAS